MESYKILLGLCLLVGTVSARSMPMRLNNETGEFEPFYPPVQNCSDFEFSAWLMSFGEGVVVDPVYEGLGEPSATELPEVEAAEAAEVEAAEASEVEAAETEAEVGAARRRRNAESESDEDDYGGEEYD